MMALGIFLMFLILGIAATIFWIWMIIDCLQNEPSGSEKIVWLLVIIFLHLLGALIYFFVRRQARP
jgi:hypothetical protein